jgi:hypothetical protein
VCDKNRPFYQYLYNENIYNTVNRLKGFDKQSYFNFCELMILYYIRPLVGVYIYVFWNVRIEDNIHEYKASAKESDNKKNLK